MRASGPNVGESRRSSVIEVEEGVFARTSAKPASVRKTQHLRVRIPPEYQERPRRRKPLIERVLPNA